MKQSKRLLTLVVLLTVLVMAVFALDSCSPKHTCEYTEVVDEEYLKSAATCTSAAVYYKSCSCGEVSGETFSAGDKLSHTYAENATNETLKTPATCTSAAVYYESCSVCHQKGDATFTHGSALSHTYEAKASAEYLKSAATCTSPAVYYKSCSNCGEKSSEIFVNGSPAAHSLEHHPATAPTETVDGNKEYWSCSGCGNYFADANGNSVISDKTSVFIPALTHTHNYNQKNVDAQYLVSEATCTASAVYNYSCSCGEKGSETFTHGNPVSHTLIEVASAENLKASATCQQLAVYFKVCSACGTKGTETFTAGELGSHAAVHHEAVAATCSTRGNVEYWNCSVCGKLFGDAACTFPVTIDDIVVSAGHTLVEIVSEDHLKSAATCTSAAVYYKYCSTCNEASSETFTSGTPNAEAHDVQQIVIEATCMYDGYTISKCANTGCNFYEISNPVAKTGHSYIETTVASTCETNGTKTSRCSVCGDVRVEILPLADHSYTDTVVAPTCETAGYTAHTCSVCDYSYNSDVTNALGHDWENGEVTVAATCTTAGTITCANDGCNQTSHVEATGHTVVAATCTEDSYCSVCDEKLADKATGHSWDDGVITLPTCTEAGSAVYTCTVCYAEKTVTDGYLATGHSTSIEWTEENVLVEGETCKFQTVQTGVCPDCDTTLTIEGEVTVVHNHVFTITTQATCQEDGVKTYTCTRCHDFYTEYYSAPEAHNYVDGVCACGSKKTVVGGNSTTASGDDLKNELEFDDASLSLDSATQEQLGGSNVDLSVGTVDQETVNNMANTLTDEEKALLEGKTVYNFEMSVDGNSVTSFDGKVTIKIPYVLADGEDPDDIVVWYLAPLYDENGDPILDENGAHKHAPTLVEAKYIEIGEQGYAVFDTEHFSYYTVTKLTAAQRCEKFGHNWLVTDVIATCLEEGYTLHYCMRCGTKEYSNFVEALGHNFELREDTYVELSCTTDGYAHYWCSRCGVGYDVITETEGHNWESISLTEATCTTAGSETFKCTVCDEEKTVTNPVLPHNYDSVVTEATCTTAGYVSNVCTDCGYSTITDYTNPYGHNDTVTTHAPTCLEQGYDEHYCDRCETVFKKDNYTAKVGHEWNVDEPDCVTDQVCKHCQKLEKPSNGHKFINGKCEHCASDCEHNNLKYSHDQKATCDLVGYKLYLCKDCNNFVAGEEIPSPPHNYKEKGSVDATCISPAYTVYRCQKCKHEHYEPVGDPIEHSFSGGVCTYCGKSSNSFYLTLLESLGNVDSFVIKLNNFTYTAEERDSVDLPWETEGSIKTVNIAELMLSFDGEGNITGAAQIDVVVFNGPIEGEEANISIRAIIENGYAYVYITNDYDATEEYSVRMEVDAFIAMYLDEAMNVGEEELELILDVYEQDILPVLELLVDANEADIEHTLESLVNILFSYEIIDGKYEYVLDFAKLDALNENLYTLPVSELIDLYFGEGTFDDIYLTVIEILETKVSDIPAYVSEYGVDEETLIAAVNSVCKNLYGAPEDFDFKAAIEDEEVKDMLIGALLMDGEYDDDEIHELANTLRANTFYSLAYGETEAEEVYQTLGEAIDMLADGLSFGFSTDMSGNVLSYSFTADEFDVESNNYYRVIFDVDLSVIFGGSIDVNWGEIIPELDGMEDAIPETEDDSYADKSITDYVSGEMEYNGELVYYSAYVNTIYNNVHNYSDVIGIAKNGHCADWVYYSIAYNRTRYKSDTEIRILQTNNGIVYLLVAGDYVVGLDYDNYTNTLTYTRPDGTSGSFVMSNYYPPQDNKDDSGIELPPPQDDSGVELPPIYPLEPKPEKTLVYAYKDESYDTPVENAWYNCLTADELLTCLGENVEWEEVSTTLDSYDFYYNTVTGEYADGSRHNYVITETKEPVDCNTPGYTTYTCEFCGDSYKNYYNNFEHNYELDEERSDLVTECGVQGTRVYVCVNCGSTYSYTYSVSHTYEHVYTLHEGATSCDEGIDCTYKCTKCGYVEWTEEYYTYGHTYEYNYSIVDGVIYRRYACAVCGTGKGTEMCGTIETEGIEISVDDSTDSYSMYLTITPSESGNYEFYNSNGKYVYFYLRDEFGSWLTSGSSTNCDLVAGQTYILEIQDIDSYDNIVIKPHDSSNDIVLSHSDYGCECGHQFTVKLMYGGRLYVEDFYGDDCILGYYTSGSYSYENCQEYYIQTLIIENYETGERFTAVEGEPIFTGNTSHSNHSEWLNDSGEYTDDNGNVITWNSDGYLYTCSNCGLVTGKHEDIYYYNANGNHIKHERKGYDCSQITGELYLYYLETEEYETVTDAYGSEHQRTTFYSGEHYNEAGVLTSYERTSYVYEGCRVTENRETSYGESYTNVYFNHKESYKDVPDESGVVDNGDGTYTEINTQERYCTICAASLRKYTNEYTYDADGYTVKHVYKYFESYAESEDVYGYRLVEAETYTYHVYEYRADGATRSVVLTTKREYYGEDGEISYWELYTYEYNYGNWCEYDIVYTNSDGDTWTDENCINHSTYRDYKLHEGSVTCTDGLDCWYVCRYCDYEYLYGEYWTYGHETNYWSGGRDAADEIHDLCDYGSQCGGYLYVCYCPCGERFTLEIDSNCELQHMSDYTWDGEGKINYYIDTYGCAVTGTADGFSPCGFVYTYEYWYTVDDSCLETYHQRYTFGLNSENPLVIETSYASGGYRHESQSHYFDTTYHVEDGYEVYVSGYEDICTRCNTKTREHNGVDYMFDSRRVKAIYEDKWYNGDGTLHYIDTEIYQLFIDEITGKTSWQEISDTHVYYNSDGEISSISSIDKYTYDYAWVYSTDMKYARCVQILYLSEYFYSLESYESGVADWWRRYEYDYSGSVCTYTRRETYSSGSEYEYIYTNHYSYGDYYWIEEPTCTQPGVRAHRCIWCDYVSSWTVYHYYYENFYYGQYGRQYHDYNYNSETGTYFCSRCELENFTGYDGKISLEDLTWKLGDSTNYAIGYANYYGISVDVFVSLVINARTDEEDEILLNDFIEMTDTGSVVYLNLENIADAIANLAESFDADWSICSDECMVRISFVPEYDDYDCVYAITLDPHVLSYTEGDIVYDETNHTISSTHSASCTLCGEVVRSDESCRFLRTYRDTTLEDGSASRVTVYTCYYCDNEFTVVNEWNVLVDASTCTYARYMTWVIGDESYDVIDYTYQNHDYDYSFDEDSVNAADGTFEPTHSMVCTTCGDVQYNENCDCYSERNYHYSTTYVEDGVSKTVRYYYCNDCGFGCKRVQYRELTDSSCCQYTEKYERSWGFNNGYYDNVMSWDGNTYYSHSYVYEHVYLADVNIPYNHVCTCEDCGYTYETSCSMSGSSREQLVDGVMHTYTDYTCTYCGFEYRRDYYVTYSDNSCESTAHYIYTWYDVNGELDSYETSNTYTNHSYQYVYTVNDNGAVVRTVACNCGYDPGYATTVTMNAPDTYDVQFVEGNNTRFFVYSVTVSATSRYKFYSDNSNIDTHGFIYDADGNRLANDDDGAGYPDFYIDITLEAGQTYYLVTCVHGEAYNGGSYYNGTYEVYFDHVSI